MACILILVVQAGTLRAEDKVFFRVKDGAKGDYWLKETSFLRNDFFDGETGGTVILPGVGFYSGQYDHYIVVEYKGQDIRIPADQLKSVHKQDEFPRDITYRSENPENQRYVQRYYLEAIMKQDRTIISAAEGRSTPDWYNDYDIKRIHFFQHGLLMSSCQFFIDKIVKTNSGYILTILDCRDPELQEKLKKNLPYKWPPRTDIFFTLIFKFDGDYIDVFWKTKRCLPSLYG